MRAPCTHALASSPRALALGVLVLASACRLFAPAVPCVVDANCRAAEVCGGDGFCAPVDAAADAGADDDGVDAGADVDAGPGPEGFTRRHRIVLDNAGNTEDLVAFPLLVRPPADVPTATTLAFFDAALAPLPFEIERWGAPADRVVWVRVPRVRAGVVDDFVWMYSSDDGTPASQDPALVWDDGYFGVWHLGDDVAAGTAHDSTGRALDGDFRGMDASDSVAAVAGRGVDLDGVNDHVRIDDRARLDIPGAFTVEAWFLARRVLEQRVVSRLGLDGQRGWQLTTEENTATDMGVFLNTCVDGTNATISRVGYPLVGLDTWAYVAGTFTPSVARRFFIDGELDTSGFGEDTTDVAAVQFQPNEDLAFGTNATAGINDNALDGRLDEIRISTVERSPSYFRATYRAVLGTLARVEAPEPL